MVAEMMMAQAINRRMVGPPFLSVDSVDDYIGLSREMLWRLSHALAQKSTKPFEAEAAQISHSQAAKAPKGLSARWSVGPERPRGFPRWRGAAER